MKLLHNCIALAILFALTGTCCVYSEAMLSGIITAKSAWLLLVTGTVLLFLTITLLWGNATLKLTWLDAAVGLFFAYIILNNTAHDLLFFSQKNVENLGLLLAYLFVKNLFTNNKSLYQPFIIFVLVLTLAQIIFAVLQWFEYLPSYNSNYKFSGFFFNPAPFVIYLSALMAYCLGIGLYHNNKLIKVAAIAIFILGLPVVAITLSRAAWLGLFTGIVVLLALKFNIVKRIGSYLKSITIRLAALAIILLLTIFAAYYLYGIKQASADGRVLVWKLAVNIIRDQPLAGTGQGGFHSSILKYQSHYFKTHPARIPTEGRLADQVAYAFNDFLQLATEQGIIGLLLFLTVIGIAIKIGLSRRISCAVNVLIPAALAAIIVLLVSGLFSYPMAVLPIQVLFFISLGILSSNTENVYTFNYPALKIPIAIAGVLAGVFYIDYAVNTYRAYTQATMVSNQNISNPAPLKPYAYIIQQETWYKLLLADELITQGKYNQAIAYLQLVQTANADTRICYKLANLCYNKKNYAGVESQYRFISFALPQLLRPKYLLAKLYYNTGQTAQWQQQASEVINFKPKIPSAFTTEMQTEIRALINSKSGTLH